MTQHERRAKRVQKRTYYKPRITVIREESKAEKVEARCAIERYYRWYTFVTEYWRAITVDKQW